MRRLAYQNNFDWERAVERHKLSDAEEKARRARRRAVKAARKRNR